jgi:TonB family protein
LLFSGIFFWGEPRMAAQASPDIRKLAERTAQRASQVGPMRALAVPMSGCVLDHQACADFDAALRAALAQKIAGLQWIEHDKLTDTLRQNHFLALDAFFPEALGSVAREAGADVLITYDLIWESTHYRLRVVVTDANTRADLAKYGATVNDSQRGPTGQPFLLPDPDKPVAFILWSNDHHAAPLFKRAECEVCPQPPISVGALAKHLGGIVVLLLTVTASGGVDDVVLAKSADPLLDTPALNTARGYIFQPPLDADGKPFAARVEIDVTFPVGY